MLPKIVHCKFLFPDTVRYLVMPTGCIDTGQTCSMQEATVMQPDADEISSTVGRSTYEYPTTRQKVVNLEVERLYEVTHAGDRVGSELGRYKT